MPASASASASSPPRPKMNGSPPLRRTTVSPRRRAVDQHGADLVLRDGVRRPFLADIDALGVRRGEVEQRVGGEVVVEDDVGLGEDAAAFDGQEVGVARAGADEVDLSSRRLDRRTVRPVHAVYTASRIRRAPRSNSSPPSARPSASASGTAPSVSARITSDAVGRGHDRHQVSAPVLDPGMRADRDLAAAAQRSEDAALRQDGRVRRRHDRAPGRRSQPAPLSRVSIASAPCPTAEHITSTGRISAIRSAHPSRFRPAAASRIASYWPSSSLRRRVSRLPRTDSIDKVRPQRPQLRGAPQRAGAHLRARAADRRGVCRRWRRADPRAAARRPAPGRPAVPSAGPSGCERPDRRGRRAAPLRSPS